MPEYNVVVVGAGPVGLASALGLAQSGIDVTVLEGQEAITSAPRDMVYQWPVLQGLQRMGVLDDAIRAGLVNDRWCFKVFKSGEQINLDMSVVADSVEHPYNLHLSHAAMTRVLLSHLEGHSNARVMWGTTVTSVLQDDDGATVTFERSGSPDELRVGWVVGADGAHSIVRRSLGLGFAGMTWPDRFVSLDLSFDFTALGFAAASYQVDPDRGAIVSQIDPGGLWRVTYAESRQLARDTIANRIAAALRERLPEAGDLDIDDWAAYRIHERAASRFRVGRLMLVGDAAHVMNPTHAFGLAAGLCDSFVLTEALAAVIHGDAADAVLDRYSDIRRRVFLEYASPVSAERKGFVFDSVDPVRLDAEIGSLRHIAADPERQREFLMSVVALESATALFVPR